MKTFCIVLACIALLSAANAQEEYDTPSYALMFGVGPNLRLGNFNMDIAGKILLDDTRSLRLLISPEVFTSDSKGTGGIWNLKDEYSQSRYSLTVACDHVWVLTKSRRFNLFAGAGLSISYSHRYEKSYEVTTTGSIRHVEANTPQAWGGFRGILGAEWSASRNLGVHVEYIPVASYFWEENKADYKAGYNAPYVSLRERVWIDLTSYVLLGVSIYM